MAVLLVVAGPQAGTRFVFEKDALLGRSSECELRVRDGRMSRRHARFLVSEEGVSVDDLGSRNGTFLNGRRLSEVVRLVAGDRVRVGNTELVFEPSADLVPARHTGGVVVIEDVGPASKVRGERLGRLDGGSDDDQDGDTDTGALSTRLAARLSPQVDAAGVLTAGLEEAAFALRADRGAVLLAERKDRMISPAAVVGGEEMLVDRQLILRVLESADALLLDTGSSEMPADVERLATHGPRVVMAAPLVSPTRPEGMIVLERRQESDGEAPWGEESLSALRATGALLGVELARVVSEGRVEAEMRFLSREGGTPKDPLLVGDGPRLRRLLDSAREAARSDAPILISGEIGSGRALTARYIHEHSTRAEGPLRLLQCALALEMDIEAMLAGEERDPELGAGGIGAIESAHGGTLYLEDLDKLPESALSMLRAARRDRMLIRMGGTRPVAVDVRFLASTTTSAGRARAQALLGPGALVVNTPPLRERPEDVPLLFSHFARLAALSLGKAPPVSLSAQGRRSAEAYEWPGNVRELKNLVERVTLLEEPGAGIGAGHFPRRGGITGLDVGEGALADQIAALESEAIAQALQEEGSKVKASKRLGISRPTLDRKMALYGLRPPAERSRDERGSGSLS